MRSYVDEYLGDERLASEAHLEHHGVLGMKWGVRRYQNKDGGLTAAGRARRGLAKTKAAGAGGTNAIAKRVKKTGKAIKAAVRKLGEARTAHQEKKLRKAMRKGDGKAVLKYQYLLSDKEISNYSKRLQDLKYIDTQRDMVKTANNRDAEARKEAAKKLALGGAKLVAKGAKGSAKLVGKGIKKVTPGVSELAKGFFTSDMGHATKYGRSAAAARALAKTIEEAMEEMGGPSEPKRVWGDRMAERYSDLNVEDIYKYGW